VLCPLSMTSNIGVPPPTRHQIKIMVTLTTPIRLRVRLYDPLAWHAVGVLSRD
jgi:hypothetical protein